jgi:magnesium transporter
MDSPRSEKSQTRFSTPVSDLDDHRHQTSTRPRGDTIGSPQSAQSPMEGQHVFHSAGSGGRPDFLQVNDQLRQAGTLSRDFEQAVIDDDRSGHGEHIVERRGSHTPGARRSTARKSQNPIPANRSRKSSRSSRSTSPANSVDAFADPRRRERANTVGSRAPSDLDLGLHRSNSGGTHRRSRRPTFNNGSVRNLNLQDDRASLTEAEDDVCFPVPDEPTKSYHIDFDELDDFVAESSKSCSHTLRQRLSFSSHDKPKIFTDLRNPVIPKIITQSSSSLKGGCDIVRTDSASVVDDKDGVNEKAEDAFGPKCSHSPEVSRYSFFSSELEQTIHAPDFADLFQPGETAHDLFSTPPDGGGVWWLDILNPTEPELNVFQRAFGIHRLTTEDIVMQEAREKVELFKQYYFVCFRSFHQIDPQHEDYMEPVNVYMVVFREGILTITYTQSPHAANVRKRIGKLRDYMALTADWICYAMIDDIVDTFGPPIHTIELEADTIEDNVFITHTEDFGAILKQIGLCRKKVMSLMRLLGGKADVIKGFAKRCNESYTVTPRGEIGLYLGDIQDHVVTMMSNLSHFEKMLSRSHANYLAQLTADNIGQGNQTNKILSKITILATILVPLNLISGLFGMNVPVPGRTSTGLGWFFGIIGCICFIVVCCLTTLRRYRFI